MIPQNKIDEIRESCDIVDVISDYVKLRPSGRNFKALSPFTKEKTPSFVVSPDKQIYKCFSSGKGGNVFTFIMEMEKVSFPEAVEIGAKRCGVDISSYVKGQATPGPAEQTAHETLKWAARLFNRLLNSSDGKTGLGYLVTKRGLTPKTITTFGLGYAPDQWEYLLSHAKRAKIPLEHLVSTGIVYHNAKKNSYYDYFRNRIMFPIFSIGGQVIGFGGRTLSNDKDTPKYLNSPESRVFDKSKVLYGLHTAKETIRKEALAILVEGYMDVLALHQADLCNAVASCGTALTREQAKILRRYTEDVLFVYDGDEAGLKSMLSGIDILVGSGLTPWIASLPKGEDPDSLIRKNGKEGFLQFVESSRESFTDFQISFYRKLGFFEQPEKKSHAVHEMLKTVALVPDTARKEFYLQELEQKVGISVAVLKEIMAEAKPMKRSVKRSEYEKEIADKSTVNNSSLSVLEKTFIKALLESTWYGNEVLEFCASHEALLKLSNPLATHILQHLIKRYREKQSVPDSYLDITTEISSISLPEARDLASGLLIDPPVSKRWYESFDEQQQKAKRCLTAFLDSVRSLILEDFREKRKRVTEKLHTAPDLDMEKKLAAELNILRKEEQTTEAEVNKMIKIILQSH
ncbi:DNA primase [Prosthecochloris sp.]|uniref:DNA primase n=1 Tax=Prosthecochloris sp. TaxID=290513 RepID=UPI0025F3B987|nr:DNA primase [Prosthecochloris sp.]